MGGVIGAGGILQGLHWKSSARPDDLVEMEERLRDAEEELGILRRENESLRSLAQGGGEMAVPGELIQRIEKELGLRFLSSPVVHQIAGEELRDRVGAAMESRFGPAGIDDRQDAYRMIGWLGPDDVLLAQLTVVRAVGARAWFDDVSGEAWVTDRFDPESIPDQAALVRVLARILLHQHFPPPPAYPGDDASRAREALHKGTGAGAESRFLAAGARAFGFVPMDEKPEIAQLLASLSPFIQGLTMFPVIEGKGLADTLYVEGEQTLHAAFRNPPQSTRAIILPAEPAAAPVPLDLPNVPEEPYLSESAGQLGLRLWLEPMGDAEVASVVSASWKNDRYLLVPDGDASAAVLWDVELDSEEAADSLESAALKYIASQAGRDTGARIGEILSTPAKRHLRVTRPAAGRVRFINAATPEFIRGVE